MNQFERSGRKFIKRHGEALFIAAFLLIDCFLSGWALTTGTILAVLWVIAPAIRTLKSLDPIGQLTYLKAFVKTQRFQRLAILLLWLYSIRFLLYAATTAALFRTGSGEQIPTLTSALILGAKEFAPIAFLASPIPIYTAACAIAVFCRTRLKATKEDPDLIQQRQKWSGITQLTFFCAYVASILSISMNTKGPAFMISNWLLASARDANFFYVPGETLVDTFVAFPSAIPALTMVDTGRIFSDHGFIPHFDIFIVTAFSSFVFLLLLQPMLRFTSFLTSFCWRVVSPGSLQNIIEAFLEALRLKERVLGFSQKRVLWGNALRTIVWLSVCYGVLFWVFGLCGGPLGLGIQNWMIASGVDAGFLGSDGADKFLFSNNYRIFLGSIVALYGTAPLAVTASVILPYAKARKITLNTDGISFYQGPYLSLLGRQTRLWSDLQSLKILKAKSSATEAKVAAESNKISARPTFELKFRSAGKIKFDTTQIPAQDLRVLLDAIDQHAIACAVDPEIFEICQSLENKAKEQATTDGIEDASILSISKQEFKSTVFVPFSPGEFIPGTKTRIIKQLASKPLCAVYLAREADGTMQIVKQFYLADETDETKAFAKILQREYDLLSKLDHPGIAKVATSFSVDKSTFLIIEHRPGSDLRAIVKEHGARSEGLTISWAEQLCEIMIFLHNREASILHRDLTPDNIIIGEDGQLRLIDFGAAREFLEGITGTMIGKQCYVAPEQLRGEATTQSDIFSFGCTLYFVLTGRDPRALSQSSPAKDLDCSEEIDQLIRDCTSFEASQRPASFEEVLQRLKKIDKGFRIKLSPQKDKVPA